MLHIIGFMDHNIIVKTPNQPISSCFLCRVVYSHFQLTSPLILTWISSSCCLPIFVWDVILVAHYSYLVRIIHKDSYVSFASHLFPNKNKESYCNGCTIFRKPFSWSSIWDMTLKISIFKFTPLNMQKEPRNVCFSKVFSLIMWALYCEGFQGLLLVFFEARSLSYIRE